MDNGEITEHQTVLYALQLTGILFPRACPICGSVQKTPNMSVVEVVQLPDKPGDQQVPWRYVALACEHCGRTDFFDYFTLMKRAEKESKRKKTEVKS